MPRPCPDCLNPLSECICDDEDGEQIPGRTYTGCYTEPGGASGYLERPPDATWAPLVLGQRVTITRGDWSSGEHRVTDIRFREGGSETYILEPAEAVDARLAAEREARKAALPPRGSPVERGDELRRRGDMT